MDTLVINTIRQKFIDSNPDNLWWCEYNLLIDQSNWRYPELSRLEAVENFALYGEPVVELDYKEREYVKYIHEELGLDNGS